MNMIVLEKIAANAMPINVINPDMIARKRVPNRGTTGASIKPRKTKWLKHMHNDKYYTAKIIKKSLILFWLLNMTIWCKHVHMLELQTFFYFLCCAFTSKARYRDEIPVFIILDMQVRNKKSII